MTTTNRRSFLEAVGFGAAATVASTIAGSAQSKPPARRQAGRERATPKIEDGAYASNMEFVAYHDMGAKPGFQMALQVVNGRHYLYSAHIYHDGFSILDVTDPGKIEYKHVPEPGGKPGTATPKISVADGILITDMMQRPEFLAAPPYAKTPFDEGIRIWDVKTDPWNPKLLGTWATGSTGTHRNVYRGGRYVHCAAAAPGFNGKIYRIVDISDPSHPVEAGRWWPEQSWTKGKYPPGRASLLMPYAQGNRAYLAFSNFGLVILDISDVSQPKFLGEITASPGLSWGSLHTALPLTGHPGYLLASSEISSPKKLGMRGIVDITDEKSPSLVSVFPLPQTPPGFPYKNFLEKPRGGFRQAGPHNWHQPTNPDLEDRPDRLYHAHFNAGVRVYDVSDIFNPKEVAYYIPPDPMKLRWPGQNSDVALATCEDVLVDKRGYIYVTETNSGLRVLRCTAGETS